MLSQTYDAIRSRNYRKNNPDKIKAYLCSKKRKPGKTNWANWVKQNPEKARAIIRRHQAVVRGANDRDTWVPESAISNYSSRICGICKQLIENDDYHIDHIIPISKGGKHVRDNLQLAHSFCNLSKGAKLQT